VPKIIKIGQCFTKLFESGLFFRHGVLVANNHESRRNYRTLIGSQTIKENHASLSTFCI